MKERAFVHILLIGIVIIALVVTMVVALVTGLDKMHREATSDSLFNKDAKITSVLENMREKKEELSSRASKLAEQNQPQNAETPRKPNQSADERLGDLRGRIEGL